MKNLVTENKDINKSVSLRLSKSLLEEINKITEVFSISLTDFIRNAIEKEVKERNLHPLNRKETVDFFKKFIHSLTNRGISLSKP